MLVDKIIIKILISEQLSQQEKQEMLNAYRDGRLKKQYRQYAKAYHPDRNPDPSAELTFQELGNINGILKKLEDGEELSRNDVETMINMVGQQKAFTINGFKEAYEKVFPQQQRVNPIAERFNSINDMRTFFNTYKRIMMNSRDPNKGQKLNFARIANEFGYKYCYRVKNISEISALLKLILRNTGSTFVEILCKPGFDPNLQRPSNDLVKSKFAFINFLSE